MTFEDFLKSKNATVNQLGRIVYPKGTPMMKHLPKNEKEWASINKEADKLIADFELAKAKFRGGCIIKTKS